MVFFLVMGVVAIVSIYKYIFRRILSSPKHIMKQQYGLRDDWIITVQDILTLEEKSHIQKAFIKKDAGSQYIKWIVGLCNHPSGDDTDAIRNDPVLLTKYQIVTQYMIECKIRFAQGYGIVLIQRDKKGKYQGSLGLIPPYPSWWKYYAHYQRAIVPIGKCVPLNMNDPLIAQRFQSYNNTVQDKKYKLMTIDNADHNHNKDDQDTANKKKKKDAVPPPSPHCWQIVFIAVVKRRKGYGKNLMKAAQLLIESHYQTAMQLEKEKAAKLKQKKGKNDNTDTTTTTTSTSYPRIYVETDAVNVSFFQEMGFQINESYPLAMDHHHDDNSNIVDTKQFMFHSMIYEYRNLQHVTLDSTSLSSSLSENPTNDHSDIELASQQQHQEQQQPQTGIPSSDMAENDI